MEKIESAPKQSKNNPWLDIIFNIILPSVILMKLSTPERLGQVNALLLGLSFPIMYGIYEFVKSKKFNGFSAFGFVSVLLTGGLGLLKMEGIWFAVKEAAIPLVIGIAVIISMKYKPLIKMMIYNENIINVDKVEQILEERNLKDKFDNLIKETNYLFASSFFLSSVLNFVLAYVILKSPSGTPEFNEELGKMYALSTPVIMIPCMIVMMFTLWKLIKGIENLTGLGADDVLKTK